MSLIGAFLQWSPPAQPEKDIIVHIVMDGLITQLGFAADVLDNKLCPLVQLIEGKNLWRTQIASKEFETRYLVIV